MNEQGREQGRDRSGGATVLIVEDDTTINQALADRFTAEGFTVVRAFDGPGAVAAFSAPEPGGHSPDVVVLDVMLPGFDGLEVCRRIQAERPVPVLMVTAKTEETDILIGLGVGADDYLTKPFRMREVVARVRALLRRVERAAQLAAAPASERPATIRLGDLVLDHAAHRVQVAGAEVHLTPLEFDLLAMLASRPGEVHARDALMNQVWGWADARGTRTLDSHVRSLRAKIGAERVRTVHGVGYALEVG